MLMLTTEFSCPQTFSSRTSYKHTKSQQKSTHAKYQKIQDLFIHHFPVEDGCNLMQHISYSFILFLFDLIYYSYCFIFVRLLLLLLLLLLFFI